MIPDNSILEKCNDINKLISNFDDFDKPSDLEFCKDIAKYKGIKSFSRYGKTYKVF